MQIHLAHGKSKVHVSDSAHFVFPNTAWCGKKLPLKTTVRPSELRVIKLNVLVMNRKRKLPTATLFWGRRHTWFHCNIFQAWHTSHVPSTSVILSTRLLLLRRTQLSSNSYWKAVFQLAKGKRLPMTVSQRNTKTFQCIGSALAMSLQQAKGPNPARRLPCHTVARYWKPARLLGCDAFLKGAVHTYLGPT